MSARPSPLTSPAATLTPPVKRRVVGEEARQLAQVRAAEHPDVRAAAGPGAGDDVGAAVAVDVARRHVHAARETPGRRRRSCASRCKSVPLKTRTCGPPPGPAPVMMSSRAVAVDVAQRHADAAEKGGVVGLYGAVVCGVSTRTTGLLPGPAPITSCAAAASARRERRRQRSIRRMPSGSASALASLLNGRMAWPDQDACERGQVERRAGDNKDA